MKSLEDINRARREYMAKRRADARALGPPKPPPRVLTDEQKAKQKEAYERYKANNPEKIAESRRESYHRRHTASVDRISAALAAEVRRERKQLEEESE